MASPGPQPEPNLLLLPYLNHPRQTKQPGYSSNSKDALGSAALLPVSFFHEIEEQLFLLIKDQRILGGVLACQTLTLKQTPQS